MQFSTGFLLVYRTHGWRMGGPERLERACDLKARLFESRAIPTKAERYCYATVLSEVFRAESEIVENKHKVNVEIKSVELLAAAHKKQLLI